MSQLAEQAGNILGPQSGDRANAGPAQEIRPQHAQQQREHRLEHIRQDHQKRQSASEGPVEVRQARVAAAVMADVVPENEPGNKDGAVGASEHIGYDAQQQCAQNDKQDLHSLSPSSPFCRMISLMGVPSKPNTARS